MNSWRCLKFLGSCLNVESTCLVLCSTCMILSTRRHAIVIHGIHGLERSGCWLGGFERLATEHVRESRAILALYAQRVEPIGLHIVPRLRKVTRHVARVLHTEGCTIILLVVEAKRRLAVWFDEHRGHGAVRGKPLHSVTVWDVVRLVGHGMIRNLCNSPSLATAQSWMGRKQFKRLTWHAKTRISEDVSSHHALAEVVFEAIDRLPRLKIMILVFRLDLVLRLDFLPASSRRCSLGCFQVSCGRSRLPLRSIARCGGFASTALLNNGFFLVFRNLLVISYGFPYCWGSKYSIELLTGLPSTEGLS